MGLRGEEEGILFSLRGEGEGEGEGILFSLRSGPILFSFTKK
jgi:hypothetical protein